MRIGVTFNVRLAGSNAGQPDDVSLATPKSGAAGGSLPYEEPSQPRGFSGWGDAQEEYDSPATIQALAEVLEGLGHEVDLLGDGEPMLRRLVKGPRPDLVLNIAEGAGACRSREARVPAVLEMLGIPHTGSDPLTLAATLDKDCAKRLVASVGVATPAWVLYRGDWEACEASLAALPFPVFVKPAYEGSSKGIIAASLIESFDDLADALPQMFAVYRQPVLVEEFIDGDELTVGVLGNEPPAVLGVMRVLPTTNDGPFIYSLEVKRDWERRVRYECPAQLAPQDFTAVEAAALASWQALGCRDVARIDFRLRDGVPYFLEANPLPGLSPTSGDLVLLARAMGVDYPELISRILQAAIDRSDNAKGVNKAARIEKPVEVA
jgi:D-alanine-D-alanine ligase